CRPLRFPFFERKSFVPGRDWNAAHPFGNLAIPEKGPMALRPTLADGLPLSRMKRRDRVNSTARLLRVGLAGIHLTACATNLGRAAQSVKSAGGKILLRTPFVSQ